MGNLNRPAKRFVVEIGVVGGSAITLSFLLIEQSVSTLERRVVGLGCYFCGGMFLADPSLQFLFRSSCLGAVSSSSQPITCQYPSLRL